MLVNNSLLFIGTPDSSFCELIDRLKADFTVNTCDSTYASVQFHSDNYEPDLVICSLERCDMDLLRDLVEIISDLLVVFPAEKSESIRELQELGLKHYIMTTEHQTAAERYIRMFCSSADIRAKEFRDRINKLVYDTVKDFSGAHCRSGMFYVIDGVKYVLFSESKHISMQSDIYPYISKMHKVSQSSIDNAIRRYVEYVYQNSESSEFIKFFQPTSEITQKPANSDFIFDLADRIFFKYRYEFYKYYICVDEEGNKK